MSDEKNGSRTWMYYVRVIVFIIPFLFAIFFWWMRGITAMAIDSKQECAVLKVETNSIKGNVSEIKADVTYIRNRIDRVLEK